MRKQIHNHRYQKAGPSAALIKVAIGAALAGALLSEAPFSRADETPEAPKLTLKNGSAYDHMGHDFRAILVMGSKLPLPMSAALDTSAGFGSSLTSPGSSNVEEAGLDLSVPLASRFSIDLYGHNSRHLAVQQFSFGADAGLSFGSGSAIIGFEQILDGGQRPLFGVLILDAIEGRLALDASGGYVTNCQAGTAGAGFVLAPGGGFPRIRLHTMTIFDDKEFLFADTRATLEYDL